MIGWRRRFERTLAAAVALALQAALYRLLLPPAPSRGKLSSSPPLIAMILSPSLQQRALPATHRPDKPQARRPVFQPIAVEPIMPPRAPQAASPAAIDWQASIRHEVRAEAAHADATRMLRFGFPRRRARRRPPPQFGWNEARIHRIQRLENGIIDLGDRCVIKLPFPIPICRFGRIPANGELFKHMHDPPRAPGSLP